MRYGFLITSALNTKFGVHTTEQRLQQTLDTISTVKMHCPDAHITLVEMAGIPITPEQKKRFQDNVNLVVDFSGQEAVKEVFKSDNWDVVKNVTEVMCFGELLKIIATHPSYNGIDRFFKLSGRYILNEGFDINTYDESVKDKIIVAKRRLSQFAPQITGGCQYQFMSRCWSFPANILPEIQEVYKNSLTFMMERLNNKGYVDIEHCLFKFLPLNKVVEKDTMGVQGLLGPNGILVKD